MSTAVLDKTTAAPLTKAAASSPKTWLLLTSKLGDNAQVEALVAAAGLEVERKRLAMLPKWEHGKPRFVPGLHHLDLNASDALEPPWPPLVVATGRRAAMAALWVKERSGGRTAVALVGRPKRWLERFDLVVAPPQYLVPEAANVVRLDLPLMRADPAKVQAAAEAWRGRLADAPRPLTAVLVGGQTRPYLLDPLFVADLCRTLRESYGPDGGTFYASTSRRSGDEVANALLQGLPAGSRLFRWGQDPPEDNPYLALLGLADRFVVTGDSVSMQVEVARTGKPLAIAPLPYVGWNLDRALIATGQALHRHRAKPGVGFLAERLASLGLVGYGRDLGALQRKLVDDGRAAWLGQPFLEPRLGAGTGDGGLNAAAGRLRALAGEGRG